MKNSVISIYIKGKPIKQGKIATVEGKPCYFANMTEKKWFLNYAGYAIAQQVLDELPRGTKIIYKRADKNEHYITNKSRFTKKGIFGLWGNHRQWVLPIKNWETKKGMPIEPKDLLVESLSEWKKGEYDPVKAAEQCARLREIARKACQTASKVAERARQPQDNRHTGEITQFSNYQGQRSYL